MTLIMAAVGDPTASGLTAGAPPPAGCIAPIAGLLTLTLGVILGGLATWFSRRRIERRLRRDVRHRDAHLARTSHELRSPLSAVLSALEIVRDGHAASDEERQLFLDQAEQAARHLAVLVDDVLDAAAIDAGCLRLAPVEMPIEALLGACDGALQLLAARYEGQLLFPAGPLPDRVLADPRRTAQVLFNLVGNALRFSPRGAPVQVAIGVAAGQACFEVRDHGPGVAAHIRARLFEPFVGEDLAASGPGTGLGLHVARQMVEQMGGSIGYRPEQPGATFWFTLPLAAEATVAPRSASTA